MAVSNDRREAPQSAMAILPRQSAPLATRSPEAAAMALERVVTMGDLRYLEPEERVAYYLDTCKSLGLNPRSRPFDWIELDGKLCLYPNKSCTDQLRAVHRIRIQTTMPEASPDGSMLRCVATAWMPDGRSDTATKFVPLIGYRRDGGTYRLAGKELANAYMKAETGAKRRVTFSLIGLAAPPADVEEVEYKPITVDGRGNILANPTAEQKALAADPGMARAIGEPVFEDIDPDRSPLAGEADQRPHFEEQPRQQVERPVLRCDAAKQRAAYFAAVEGTPLATDEGRAAFLREYTARYSPALRTDSLSRFLSYSGDRQASEMVQSAKLKAESWRLSQAIDEPSQPVVNVTPEVHAAVLLTGGAPPQAPTFEASAHGRPEHGGEYSADEWRAFYRVWAGELRKRDTAYTVWPDSQIKRATMAALAEEVWSCIGQVDSIDEMEMLADLDASRGEDAG